MKLECLCIIPEHYGQWSRLILHGICKKLNAMIGAEYTLIALVHNSKNVRFQAGKHSFNLQV